MDNLNLYKEISNTFLKLNVKDISIDFKRTGSFVIRGYLTDSNNLNPYIEFRYDKSLESLYVRINKGGKDIHAIFTTTVSLKGLNLKNFFASFYTHVVNTLANFNINLILDSINSTLVKNKVFIEKAFKTAYLYFSSDNYTNGFDITTSNVNKELKVRLKQLRSNNMFLYSFSGENYNDIYIKYTNANNFANGDKVEFGNDLKKFIDTYGKVEKVKNSVISDIWTERKLGVYKDLKGHLKFSDEDVEYTLYIEYPNVYTLNTNDGYEICLVKLKNHVLYLDNFSVKPLIFLKDKFLKGVNFENPILIWDKILIESVKDNGNKVFESAYKNDKEILSVFSKYLTKDENDLVISIINTNFWEFE